MSTEILHKATKKSLVPQLRFSEFEEEWKEKKLESITKKISIKNKENFTYPVYSISNIHGFIPQSEQFEGLDSTGRGYDISMYKIIGPNTFAYNPARINVGSIGYSQNLDKIIISSLYVCFITNEQIDDYFLMYYLKSFRFLKDVSKNVEGGVRDYLFYENFSKIDIKIPSINEQQKIASFLTAVDEKIQQLTRKKELLEQYKKGVMQQLFSGELRFKDENGKDFPEWEEKKLGEVAKRNSNKNKNNLVDIVLTNSATQGVVNQSDYFDREIANQNNLEGYYIVEIDDFVYNPRISVHAPVGPIKRNKLSQGVMSPLYSVFSFTHGILEYFEYFFETKSWHEYLESVSNKGARHDRMNITNSDFFKMPIPFPCKKEQQKIADFLSSIDVKIENVNQQLNQAQQFKKGLLQQMFV